MSDIENLVGELRLSGNRLMQRAADALEARQPTEDDREALARVMDTLAYYHCRSVNPKADHPRMGYHAMTEDQREHLREKQREAAEEIRRMIPSLSRAAVPDAATEAKQPEGWSTEDRREAKCEAERRWSRPVMRVAEQRYQAGNINGFILGAEWQKARETFISYKAIADQARAERDAALAAVERVRAAVEKHRHWFDCFGWHVPTIEIVAALDGAPEPEWEYIVTDRGVSHGKSLTCYEDFDDARRSLANIERNGHKGWSIIRRRKAGPWEAVEGESK